MDKKNFGSLTNIETVRSISSQIDALSNLTANPHRLNEFDSKMLERKASVQPQKPPVHSRPFPFIHKAVIFVKRYILARISKKVNSWVQMSDSLESLATINSNVDELMKIRAPYRETIHNYEILTEYLYKANKIHTQISRSMKK